PGTTKLQARSKNAPPDFRILFLTLLIEAGSENSRDALQTITTHWQDNIAPMAIEVTNFLRPGDVERQLNALINRSLLKSTASLPGSTGSTINDHYYRLWNQNIKPYNGYADFKADMYRLIDPRFEYYFRDRQETATIRLDEIRWGGVRQDGIPPLRNPSMIPAAQASYLDDTNIVFGIEINGDARAYPKRILAWHEMFTDSIGGVPIAGVYCTLCGAVIPFRTEVNGQSYQLGTSGFLYRSNKLMYDKATQSLWSTTRGEPVLGPLAGKGITLPFESVVTTTWGAWRKRHPETSVLSLDTGHERNYGEGVAYAAYFGSDKLMFNTPFNDTRLANKREVLALRFAAAPDQQLAIDTDFLSKNPLYAGQIGLQRFVVLTDTSGANRVYDPGDVRFRHFNGASTATDDEGNQWTVHESWLQNNAGMRLARLPYHRAFWFGWRAAFPDTQLIR
ncbi:MAG: DUF3179 domain-containing protein, partial [Burkholderiaceae bacterium]